MSIATENYRSAGIAASYAKHSLVSTRDMLTAAMDAAVAADRTRMADQLRMRVLMQESNTGLPAQVDLRVQELLLDLADQIIYGMDKEHTDGTD